MQSIIILGRQPALGLAELESLYGANTLQPVGNTAVLLDVPVNEINFPRLGGSIKLAKVLTALQTTDWAKLIDYIVKTIPEHLHYLPEGKLKFGLSVFGLPVQVDQINRSALSIKKVIKAAGRSVRVVPNSELSLNSAAVRHNQLTGELGMELLLIRDGHKTILAQTVDEQDIDGYAARDQERPKRDARVGMLPPKLAQIIVNLANPPQGSTVLDPFCGTGVVLQEAALMGYGVIGTDLEQRMVDYAHENVAQWLPKTFNVSPTVVVQQGDAINTTWNDIHTFEAIAGETYLGRPFSTTPDESVLSEVMQDVDTIHKKFLRNVAMQTKTGFRMCIAIPAWKTTHGFKHLKMLETLTDLGYNRIKFEFAAAEDLIYHREGQIVGRELVVLQRN